MIVTFVLGLVAAITLISALKLGKPGTLMNEDKSRMEQEVSESTESKQEGYAEDGELNIERELFELDKMGLDNIEEEYTESKLDY
jgi:hypothetical protein